MGIISKTPFHILSLKSNISAESGREQLGRWLFYCNGADITINCTTTYDNDNSDDGTAHIRPRSLLTLGPGPCSCSLRLHFLFHNFRYPKDLGCMGKMHTGYDTRRFFGCRPLAWCGKRGSGLRFWFHFCTLCLLSTVFLPCFQLQFSLLHPTFHTLCYYMSRFQYFLLISALEVEMEHKVLDQARNRHMVNGTALRASRPRYS